MQVSTIQYQDLNQEFRIDAEYYREEILSRLNILQAHNKCKLDDVVDFIIGPFGSTVTVDKYVEQSEYRYIRNKDINDFRISGNEPALISKDTYNHLPRFHIQKNDLLITVVGTLGKVAIASHADTTSIFSCKSTLLRVTGINPFYLLAYLNSDTGRLFSLRGKRGAIQEGLNLTDLKEIQIFMPSNRFQITIEQIIKKSFAYRNQSEILFDQTKRILLAELGLSEWTPEHQLSFVKNHSDLDQCGRMDAEYFQPKYDEIVEAIKSYSGGWDTLENMCELVGHPSNPPYAKTEDEDKTFIVTQKHLGEFSLNDEFWKDDDALYTTADFIDKNKRFLLKKNDVLLYSVGAYIGKANVYLEDIKATIGSFLTLLRAKEEKINDYVLMVFLNTDIGIMLSKQHQRGMAQQYLYPYDIRTFPVPLLKADVQVRIQQQITESFSLRKQSKHLLECAKRAVEIAIEQDEDTAMQWLQEQTAEIL